jgi:hypothetical protein
VGRGSDARHGARGTRRRGHSPARSPGVSPLRNTSPAASRSASLQQREDACSGASYARQPDAPRRALQRSASWQEGAAGPELRASAPLSAGGLASCLVSPPRPLPSLAVGKAAPPVGGAPREADDAAAAVSRSSEASFVGRRIKKSVSFAGDGGPLRSAEQPVAGSASGGSRTAGSGDGSSSSSGGAGGAPFSASTDASGLDGHPFFKWGDTFQRRREQLGRVRSLSGAVSASERPEPWAAAPHGAAPGQTVAPAAAGCAGFNATNAASEEAEPHAQDTSAAVAGTPAEGPVQQAAAPLDAFQQRLQADRSEMERRLRAASRMGAPGGLLAAAVDAHDEPPRQHHDDQQQSWQASPSRSQQLQQQGQDQHQPRPSLPTSRRHSSSLGPEPESLAPPWPGRSALFGGSTGGGGTMDAAVSGAADAASEAVRVTQPGALPSALDLLPATRAVVAQAVEAALQKEQAQQEVRAHARKLWDATRWRGWQTSAALHGGAHPP